MSPEVTLGQGAIRGEQRSAFNVKKYYSFEGIPYAKPPIGALRFRDPQPSDAWSGVKDCTKPGNKCAQINPTSRKGFEGSEDCLYLNVYTPHLPKEKPQKLPVIFFVHGGRLTFGYGDYYKPDYLIRHDVIIVTFNYRLNILGFLSLDTQEVPGNAGAKDCVAALKWVRSNIEVFGGDVNNITIFGESAGGAIGTAFLCSKMTEGLFHKLIAQSGNHLGDIFMCFQDHVDVARRVAKTLGKETKDKEELLDFFRSLPVDELVQGYTFTKNYKTLHPLLMPVVEKEFAGVESFMHEPPIESFRLNRFWKVPTITGLNTYEGAAFLIRNKKGEIVYIKDLKKFVPSFLYLKDDDPKCAKIAKEIMEYYFKNREVNDETKLKYIQLSSDAFFNRDTLNFAELVSRYNSECYFYSFRYVGNLNISNMEKLGIHGTSHGDPVQYQFFRSNQAQKTTEKDWRVIDFFTEAFTNFAKYSKLTWNEQKIQWAPFTPKEKLTLIIDEELKIEKSEHADSFKFWNTVCGERAKL